MLVLQGTTPEETRTSIVRHLNEVATNYEQQASGATSQGLKMAHINRVAALRNEAKAIEECFLTNITPPSMPGLLKGILSDLQSSEEVEAILSWLDGNPHAVDEMIELITIIKERG